jgi:TPR repeat protein
VCNAQGAALVRIQLSPPAQRLRLRTIVPVYSLSFAMKQMERLNIVGNCITAKIAMLMSQGEGGPSRSAHYRLIDCIVQRLAARRVAKSVDGFHARAVQLWSVGQCAAAALLLQRAVDLGHLPSRADLADMLLLGREGVSKDRTRALALAQEGARLGCQHCQGVIARVLFFGQGCSKDEARSLALARESAAKGSKYGQRLLGYFYQKGLAGVMQDRTKAVSMYQLAAAQNYDEAQNDLGFVHENGIGVVVDYAEALRWFKLAANQGHPTSSSNTALLYRRGRGIPADKAEAIFWYRRAAAAGHLAAAAELKKLGVAQ